LQSTTPAGWRAAARYVTNNSQTRRNWLGRPRVGLAGKARCPSNNVCLLPRPPQHAVFSPSPIFALHLPESPSSGSASRQQLISPHGQRYTRWGPPSSLVSRHTRLWGVHWYPVPASNAILARGTWKAKLACPRSKHTTYPLCFHNTPWCTLSSPSPHPHPLPQHNCSWTSTPSTQLPRFQRPKGSSPSCPSRHRRCRLHRACQTSQHSRASTVVLYATLLHAHRDA
jgi:hypothetical protein